MGALKLTACMKVVSEMSDLDRDALLDRLEGYIDDGVPTQRAQVMAAADTLAELEDERRQFMRMLKEQHPEIFVVAAPAPKAQPAAANDTSEQIRKSADRTPLGFYSALARSIDGVPIKSAPAGAWQTAIKGLLNKGAVKQDELEWSGLEDWMALQPGKISKEQVAEYLEQGGVRVTETVLSGKPAFDSYLDAIDYIAKSRGTSADEVMDEYGYSDPNDYVILANGIHFEGAAPKYDRYTLPGGENYREVLLTLPDGRNGALAKAEEARLALRAIYDSTEDIENRKGRDSEEYRAAKQELTVARQRYDAAERAIDEGKNSNYKSNHWDQPNVLAHIRVNDRTDADGDRVLFVEELQSDWGQEGKKRGFKSEAPVLKIGNLMRDKGFAEVVDQDGKFVTNVTEYDVPGLSEEAVLAEANRRVQQQPQRTAESSKVPAAPFVTKTEGWLNLALKRIMVMAAEGGYDKVAFVNGEQSAERYDLSKRVQKIEYSKNNNGYDIDIYGNEGTIIKHDEEVSVSELEDLIGKEITQKIVNGEGYSKNPLGGELPYKILSGLDLKVGGEGMKAFYNQIVPLAVKKLLPKVGGGQMGQVTLTNQREDFDLDALENATPEELAQLDAGGVSLLQPGFDVTPAMLEKVAGGLPLFSRDRVLQDKDDAVKAIDLVKKARAYQPEEGEARIAFPLLFHSGTGDPRSIANYIEPQFGSWVAEVLEGAYDDKDGNEAIDPDEAFVSLSYYSPSPEWIRIQTARKMDKQSGDVTLNDIRKNGQLALVYNVDETFGDAVNEVYQIGPDGYNGGYTDVIDAYGQKRKLYETGLEEQGDYRSGPKQLFGVEPGDIVSKETITPDLVLVGDALVEFMRQYQSQIDPEIRFSRDRDYEPKKTVKAYKLFRTDARQPGELFPLFVLADQAVPMGEWLRAEIGPMTGDKVKSKLGPLAFRPGWHAGDVPVAAHIGMKDGAADKKPKYRNPEHVWAEVEFAADVDWQAEANQRGTNASGKLVPVRAAITDQLPAGGFYRYKTNPNMQGTWLIGGEMKVSRVLSDSEVKRINDKAGTADLPRKEPLDLKAKGFPAGRPTLRKSEDRPGGDSDVTMSADRPWFDDLSKLKISTNYQLGDLLKSSKKLNWWNRTVGTQYNLAQKNPEFKRVFDAVQTFINDVSAYASRAADLAPTILPKLETLKDLAKSPLSAQDVKALRDPIFGGTLNYTRDDEGNLIEAEDVSTAGVVFTNDELRDLFGLDDRQVKLYREFRRATNKSLSDLAVADMLRYLGKDGEGIRQRALAATNLDGALDAMVAHLDQLIEQQPKRAEVLEDTKRAIKEKAGQAIGLMARGYAPLSRFGQYTVYAVGQDGEQLYFSMFENQRDANKMAREMREQYPEATVTTGTMSQESYKLFSGVTPETLALFGESLGLEESGIDAKSEVFQQYLKMAKTNRSAMKRLIQRKGIDGFSEDAGRVLAGFVYSNARQISTNLHAGEIGRSASEIQDGDVKDHAIRLMQYIQNPTEEAQALKGLLFNVFLGGNISSALVNISQTATTTFPYLSQFDGTASVMKRLGDATKLAVRGIRDDDELRAALKRAEDEGIVSPQEVFHLMAQAQGKAQLQTGDGTRLGDALAKTNNFMTRATLVWGRLFSAAEQANRRIAFIAAYKLARDKNMENPFAFAEKAVLETQFSTNKGIRPAWARGAVGGVLFTFKGFTVAYLELLGRMLGNGPEGKKAFALALGTLFLFAGAAGLPFMDDLDDVIDGFAQRVLNKSFDSKQAKREFFASILGQTGADFVMGGISSLPGAPIDVSGRLGLGNIAPGTGILPKKSNYQRDAMEIFGPAGSLFSNYATAIAQLAQGEVKAAATTAAPVGLQNVVKGMDMATMGFYRDTRGRKVIDTNGWEAVAKSMGFQPSSVKRIQDATSTQQGLIAQNKLRETEIADKMAKARIERKPDLEKEAREELADWNRTNPESPIRIDASQINRRVQQAMMDKAKRIEKTAPKEIRADVKRELERAN